MSETNTLPEIKRLHGLAKTIRQTHEAATKLAEATRKKGSEAIAEALLCGQALIEAKELVGHGGFQAWVEEHCGEVTYRTAARYMRLTKYDTVSHLEAGNLRQAYIEAGIITESCKPKSKPNEQQKQETSDAQSQPSESLSESSIAQAQSNSESDASVETRNAGPESPSAIDQPTFPIADDGPFMPEPDPFLRLRTLVGYVMTEIEKLGDGAKGGIAVELCPVIELGREWGFA